MQAPDIAKMNIDEVRRELVLTQSECARLDARENALASRMEALLRDAEQRAAAGVRIVDNC